MQRVLQLAWPGMATLSPEYSFLGPFPIAAREQHTLSPSYPLADAAPPTANATYPSSLVDGGLVQWQSTSDSPGVYDIAYSTVLWESLRGTLGWAALQHHTLVHTTLTVDVSNVSQARRALKIDLKQASYIALAQRGSHAPLQWLEGDIYAQSTISRYIPLPTSLQSIVYDVYLSVDYEIRLFGDPVFSEGGSAPKSKARLAIDVVDIPLVKLAGAPIVPDFVDGWALGDIFGLDLQVGFEWCTLLSVSLDQNFEGTTFTVDYDSASFAPLQCRRIPLIVTQTAPLASSVKEITLLLTFSSSESNTFTIKVTLPIVHHLDIDSNNDPTLVLRQTHRSPHLAVSSLLPPLPGQNGQASQRPALLALHGAGVDPLWPWWTSSLPRRPSSWTVFPSGLGPWGFDWRGPSALNVISSLEALRSNTKLPPSLRLHSTSDKPIIVGHSNGGQGTFHFASHYPDLISGAIPVSGYLTAASYVPLSFSHATHFTDPTLGGILAASTGGGDNDLFLGNLATLRTRIFHGGADENVPVWMGRKILEIVKAWSKDADVTFTELPGKPHWWDGALREPAIERAIEEIITTPLNDSSPSFNNEHKLFTLSVVWPRESGSLHGWRIIETSIPGRFAKLQVQRGGDGTWKVQTTNVWSLSVDEKTVKATSVVLDGQRINIDDEGASEEERVWLGKSKEDGTWTRIHSRALPHRGPISRILSLPSPLSIVIPSAPHVDDNSSTFLLSLGLRVAHNLLIQFGIDSNVIADTDALQLEPQSGVIVIGGPSTNVYAQKTLEDDPNSPITFDRDGRLRVQDRTYDEPGTGALFIRHKTLHIHGVDASGYDRAIRAFPFRTGVPNPEWMILGKDMDARGTGGLLGAGFWDREGKWSESMSWLS